MFLFGSSENLGALRKVRDENEDKEGDSDGNDALDDKDPAPAICGQVSLTHKP